MKIFISYSRDDKIWVYELWRALRDRAHHDVWVDQRIVPAQDWWHTILHNIEEADCVIYAMSPKAVESIYCRAEVDYAVALNKPVIPLMLKPCDYPPDLTARRIQYEMIQDDVSLGDVLFLIQRAVGEIQLAMYRDGAFQPPNPTPKRPEQPRPAKKPEQVAEVFMMAEEAAAEDNLTLAEKLFEQVKTADPNGYGLAAAQRLGEIRFERDRSADYLSIVQMVANPKLHNGARALWRVFVEKFGTDFDPNGIGAILAQPPVGATFMSPAATPPKQSPSTDLATADAIRRIIGDPFEWCDVPAGKFLYGDDKQKLTLPAFAIAKYAITYRQFEAFVQAKDGFYDPRWWEGFAKDKPDEPRGQGLKEDDHPRERVSWYHSMAFCRWLSFKLGGGYAIDDVSRWLVRLPTEFEWEKAACGTDGRIYPWGDKFDSSKCNTSESYLSRPVPVTNYANVESPYGVVQMAGNVFEWCLTNYDNPVVNPGKENIRSNAVRVLRGGSWLSRNDFARAASRYNYDPSSWTNPKGFRVVCVRPPSL